ncbi:ANTAR domain-containing protein [Amycolatopsis alkalitolerans]|uniref:GAF and ANTAR domain-containing protein n=1 Tax=Amycolatopsis alkalitolerans TaxID=2547244 RepID=A0A5C4LTR8_9PSEU|nr:GAF and ANTAR domain-containing protein [Amycolatopsis alkalitolerans]TNC20990.1 GAF and ANTAR domain-containing protein [Amycolatopsis alkalitolerans]
MTNDHCRSPQARRAELAAAFAELCDLRDSSLDEAGCLDRLVRHSAGLLDVDGAGVLLADAGGEPTATAGSCETVRLLQLLQVRFRDGPGVISFRTHVPVHVADLREVDHWESFRTTALRAGYLAVHALPLRHHADGLGALTLFRKRSGALSPGDCATGAALSTVAASLLLDRRELDTARTRTTQLQTALDTRIAIEQAKGVLTERHALTPEAAFELIRAFARRDRRRIDDVAREVIAHSPAVAALLDPQPTAR